MRALHLGFVSLIVLSAFPLCYAADQPAATLASLPVAAQASISQALGKDAATYHVQAVHDGYSTTDARQALTAHFTPSGIDLRNADLHWKFSLQSFGYGDARQPQRAIVPTANDNRVEYRRGSLTEWYSNGPVGLEQGFTISQAPGKARGCPLTIALAISGSMQLSQERNRTGLLLKDRAGHPQVRYSGLTALDASGRELHAWLQLQGQQLLLRVDDAGARYPIVVDPWIQLAELTASDGTNMAAFGFAVAISGSTVVVGAPGESADHGAAYVFVKSANGWQNMTQTAKLTPSGDPGFAEFGISVSIAPSSGASAANSGTTIVVGGREIEQILGYAYVYVEPPGGWVNMTETARLSASDGVVGDWFGSSVTIRNNLILVGAAKAPIGSNSAQGAAYLYVEPAGGWTSMSQTAKFTASDGAAGDWLGYTSSMNGTNTLVVSAPNATINGNYAQGALYVYVEPPGGWTSGTETAKLTAFDGRADDDLGDSVAMSGNTIVGGASLAMIGNNSQQGAAYVYVKPASGWTTTSNFTSKLTASDGGSGDWLGVSSAIFGNTILVGAPHATVHGNSQQGAVYVFTQPAGDWQQYMNQSAKLTASDGAADDDFGWFVGISSTSALTSTVIVGADGVTMNGNIDEGAAYVFSTQP